jgi:hypothetical protein
MGTTKNLHSRHDFTRPVIAPIYRGATREIRLSSLQVRSMLSGERDSILEIPLSSPELFLWLEIAHSVGSRDNLPREAHFELCTHHV